MRSWTKALKESSSWIDFVASIERTEHKVAPFISTEAIPVWDIRWMCPVFSVDPIVTSSLMRNDFPTPGMLCISICSGGGELVFRLFTGPKHTK